MAHDQRGAKALLPHFTQVFSLYAQSFSRAFRFLTIERHDWPAGHDSFHQRIRNIRDAGRNR
jgi:hypothetical protein